MNLHMQKIQHALETLKLNAIATEWSAIADHTAAQQLTLAEFLDQLLRVELDARMSRTRETLLKCSGLPVVKHFEDYDFKFATGAPRKQLQELTSLAFIERA